MYNDSYHFYFIFEIKKSEDHWNALSRKGTLARPLWYLHVSQSSIVHCWPFVFIIKFLTFQTFFSLALEVVDQRNAPLTVLNTNIAILGYLVWFFWYKKQIIFFCLKKITQIIFVVMGTEVFAFPRFSLRLHFVSLFYSFTSLAYVVVHFSEMEFHSYWLSFLCLLCIDRSLCRAEVHFFQWTNSKLWCIFVAA